MGYRHGWHIDPRVEADDARWKAVIADARELIARSELPLSSGDESDYSAPPLITCERICLNGLGRANACMDFELPLWTWGPDHTGLLYGQCKTARQPYDQMVCAILISVEHHFGGDISVHSDGRNSAEWIDGASERAGSPVALYTHVFPDRALPPRFASARRNRRNRAALPAEKVPNHG